MLDTDAPAARVFITGAAGFIGRALAERLLGRGCQVSGVDRQDDPARQVVAGDVAQAGDWQRAADGSQVVIHTAAVVSNALGLEAQWRVNVLGTRRALDAAVAAGAKRFLHISSVRAFSDLGFPDGVTEEHPVRPDGNAYVDTKIASEQVVWQAHARGEIECVVIRPGDVYGPGSRVWTVLPVQAIKARQFVLPARGRGIFSPVFVANLLDGVELAVAHPAAAGEVFTLSDGVGVSCREFFGHYSRMLGMRPPVGVPTAAALALAFGSETTARFRRRDTEANRATIRYFTRTGTYSIAKARRVLGYEPRVSLEAGMRLTEEWLRAEGLL